MPESPFSPSSGQAPPLLAGRDKELQSCRELFSRSGSVGNILVTGLHGLGKTSLLGELKVIAQKEKWFWVGSDLSQNGPLTEEDLARRILKDIAVSMSAADGVNSGGTLEDLTSNYNSSPGLVVDKLKSVFQSLSSTHIAANYKGILLAYDEAHLLCDPPAKESFCLPLLVELVNAFQKQETATAVHLVLSGLPHLFDEITSGQSYAERMFHLMPLYRLTPKDTEAAIKVPLERIGQADRCPTGLIKNAIEYSGGYPCFIQFFGDELYRALSRKGTELETMIFPDLDVWNKLDGGSFTERWGRLSDKERAFLGKIVNVIGRNDLEFSIEELSTHISGSQGVHQENEIDVPQMLELLRQKGLVYPKRPGCYALATPMTETLVMLRFRQQPGSRLKSWFSRSRSRAV